MISLVFGQPILNFFGIGIDSFRIGGGILIGSMAFSMLSAKPKINEAEMENTKITEIGIVPLAIPLLSGPGAISTSIIHAEHFDTTVHWIGSAVAIFLIGIAIKLLFKFSRPIGKKLGQVGVNVMTRIMGLILMSLAVEFVVGGLKSIFKTI